MTFWVSGTTAGVDATAVVALADLGVDGAVAVADPELAQAAAFSRNDSIKVCLKNSIAKTLRAFKVTVFRALSLDRKVANVLSKNM